MKLVRKLRTKRTPPKRDSDAIKGYFESSFDPNGGYTGTPTDGIRPVQDADDL